MPRPDLDQTRATRDSSAPLSSRAINLGTVMGTESLAARLVAARDLLFLVVCSCLFLRRPVAAWADGAFGVHRGPIGPHQDGPIRGVSPLETRRSGALRYSGLLSREYPTSQPKGLDGIHSSLPLFVHRLSTLLLFFCTRVPPSLLKIWPLLPIQYPTTTYFLISGINPTYRNSTFEIMSHILPGT